VLHKDLTPRAVNQPEGRAIAYSLFLVLLEPARGGRYLHWGGLIRPARDTHAPQECIHSRVGLEWARHRRRPHWTATMGVLSSTATSGPSQFFFEEWNPPGRINVLKKNRLAGDPTPVGPPAVPPRCWESDGVGQPDGAQWRRATAAERDAEVHCLCDRTDRPPHSGERSVGITSRKFDYNMNSVVAIPPWADPSPCYHKTRAWRQMAAGHELCAVGACGRLIGRRSFKCSLCNTQGQTNEFACP
jgi:hypothetical protein